MKAYDEGVLYERERLSKPYRFHNYACLQREGILIKSMQSLLAQDYTDIIEILCIDGGSSDGTQEIIRRFQKNFTRIRLLDNPYRV